MKTETYPEEANLTVGQILRQAREKHELSQQTVADRLCLKLSTVRDIEEDNIPSNIVPTFFRGYIRAYAKLVQLPESEILTILDKQMPTKTVKVSPMQSFSSGKIRKKRDGWLMKITWIVIIFLLGMTGLWWWQNYKAQQKELSSMVEQSSTQTTQAQSDENDLSTSSAAKGQVAAPLKENQPVVTPQDKMSSAQVTEDKGENSNTPAASSAPASTAVPSKTVSLPVNQPIENAESTSTATAPNSVVSTSSADVNNISTASNNELVMDFSGRSWLEIKDAKGKVLFNGTKSRGDSLKFAGELPYSLNIGVPSQVKIQFQGKAVDLSTFIKKGTPAKLTLK
ncbi:cytoskeleton protein RodZ [Xenorhabdus hominickii]|uniref:Cytoskeletal protein RodZ n=1 Tax=Xenorhabdus hominickii TaxID=351679 RepID=A0A2G0Q6U8_XENHO|nr:cytoskeleton protein RodZ [Xenorhabdus hominickii]AOM39315.1 cytoskeletal protein RodZ [Xenorhabdus hominickii]PHM54942.1 cytoskeletal protein RodZ [Xenorhabdus hominickii]